MNLFEKCHLLKIIISIFKTHFPTFLKIEIELSSLQRRAEGEVGGRSITTRRGIRPRRF